MDTQEGQGTDVQRQLEGTPQEQGQPKPHSLIVWVILSTVVLAGAALFFLWPGSSTNELSDATQIKVRLSWVHQGQFSGFYVAKDKGFYEEAGLDVELLELDQDVNQVEELNRGDVDFSVMEAHQMLSGIDSGADLMAAMAVYQINPHVLAARSDSGIDGPEDFAGKVIGLAGGIAEGNALFQVFVERFGNTDSVTYKNLGFDTVGNFERNDADIIDLYEIDQPYLAEKRGISLNIISLEAYGFSTYGDVLAVRKDMLSDQPDVVQRFVRATIRGWEHVLENQSEAVEITLRYASGDYADPDYQAHIIQRSVPLIRGTQTDLGRMELVSWSTLYESMQSARAIANEFDVREVYTNEFIDQ